MQKLGELTQSPTTRWRNLVLVPLLAMALTACGGSSTTPDGATASETSDESILGKISGAFSGLRRTRNKPPTISGDPLTAIETAKAYVFQPTASDPEGQPLTFTVANMPSWMHFDASTGALTGVPSAALAGVYANIVVAVSDGRNLSSLAPFNVSVLAPSPPPTPVANNATIQWNAPTTNEDGSTLTNLAGFKVYYGRAANTLDQVIQIASPSTTSQVIQNLTTGTWYFAVSTLNAAGIESQLSALATRSFP